MDPEDDTIAGTVGSDDLQAVQLQKVVNLSEQGFRCRAGIPEHPRLLAAL
jgi:hypothetical protein